MKNYLSKNLIVMKVINAFLFQAGWFLSVFSIKQDNPFLAVIFIVSSATFHLIITSRPWKQLQFYCLAAFLGFFVETIIMNLGAFQFKREIFIRDYIQISPIVMVMMWVNFATTFHYSLAWLKDKLWLGILLGGIGGPLSYFSGHTIGAIYLSEPAVKSLFTIGILWCFAMPILQVIYRGVYKNG